jgi:ribosomal protein S18 acetylase RimI-like enzyme
MTRSIQRNLHNLTSLWQVAGEQEQAFVAHRYFKHVLVSNAEWPNRLWFNNTPGEAELLTARKCLNKLALPLYVPHWLPTGNSQQLFDQQGFELVFKQSGMSIVPQKKYHLKQEVQLRKVETGEEIQQWSELFHLSFGYLISPRSIRLTKHLITYYLIEIAGSWKGTLVAFETEGTLGLHSLGIPPQYRRQGIAEDAMKKMLNESVEQKRELLTLQASEMGKALYLRLGFRDEFPIYNYRLK